MASKDIEVKRGEAPAMQRARWSYRPLVDIAEGPDEYLVCADMPGAGEKEIGVSFDNGTLAIHGPVPERRPVRAEPLLEEYGIGDFDRQFGIFEGIDAERIEADYRDGVLTVRLPKSQATRRRQIPVRTE